MTDESPRPQNSAGESRCLRYRISPGTAAYLDENGKITMRKTPLPVGFIFGRGLDSMTPKLPSIDWGDGE